MCMILPRDCKYALSPRNIVAEVQKGVLESLIAAYEKSRVADDCEYCKESLEEIPESLFPDKVVYTIENMRDSGTEIGCDSCEDLGRYITSILRGDETAMDEPEGKYIGDQNASDN